MSENEKNLEPELPAFVKKAPELIPLWDWWVKEGRSTAIMVAVAGLAVAAFYGTRNWMKGRDAAASAALVKMASPNAPGGGLVDEQEEAVATYGSTKAGPKMKIVLAKSYFDAERYEDALQVYDELVKDAGKNQDMADIAAVGRAQALEGIASQDESEDGRKAKYKAASEAFADRFRGADRERQGRGGEVAHQARGRRCQALQAARPRLAARRREQRGRPAREGEEGRREA